MCTGDGLSKHPYIREGRRIVALRTVVEEDVSAELRTDGRARHFPDSVGLGWYPIDIHLSAPEEVGVSTPTLPFQIPLGALIPTTTVNLIAAAKNIGTTHITNGCYRLHPVEWNIGEAAGTLAAVSLEQGVDPAKVWSDPDRLRTVQHRLVQRGVPIAWSIDVPVSSPAFVAVQTLLMKHTAVASDDLRFFPTASLSQEDWEAWGGTGPAPPTRAEGARRLFD